MEKPITIFVCIILTFIIGGICWQYSINEWLQFFGIDKQLAFWQGGLLAFVPIIGQISITFAVVTWILMMFLL